MGSWTRLITFPGPGALTHDTGHSETNRTGAGLEASDQTARAHARYKRRLHSYSLLIVCHEADLEYSRIKVA